MNITRLHCFSRVFLLILIFTTFILEYEASYYCVVLENTRFVGSVHNNIEIPTLENCISSCSPLFGCVAVNYFDLKCLVVYKDIPKTTFSNLFTAVICGHVNIINEDCDIFKNTTSIDSLLPDEFFEEVPSAEECKGLCLGKQKCNHAVYDEKSAKCNLYFMEPQRYTFNETSTTIVCNHLKRNCSMGRNQFCTKMYATCALMFPVPEIPLPNGNNNFSHHSKDSSTSNKVTTTPAKQDTTKATHTTNSSEISIQSTLTRFLTNRTTGLQVMELCICEEGSDCNEEKLIVEKTTTIPPASKESSSNNNAVVIGLGVAVPLVLIVVILVVCVAIYYNRRQNNVLKREENEMNTNEEIKVKIQPVPRTGHISGDISKPLDKWELDPQNIDICDKLGNGAFGMVYSAFIDINTFRTPISKHNKKINSFGKKRKIAVKMLKDFADESEKSDFHEEIELMKKIGYHQNIVSMIGCSTVTSPKCLVVEYMSEGDLLKFLRKRRKNLTQTQDIDQKTHDEDSKRYVTDPASKLKQVEKDNSTSPSNESLTPEDLISFAWQISSGMEYLASKKLVHRDLACRNILVGDDNNLKISDFGLSRYVNEDLIYSSKNTRKLPVRWMSIEAIFDYEFTTYSDIWAFGIVLFEIVTIGGTPYPGMGNTELLKLLKSGYRMEKPDNCSKTIYEIMLECWNADPQKRPSFKKLREKFEAMVSDQEEYITFGIDVEKSLYFTPSYDSEKEEEGERDALSSTPHCNTYCNENSTPGENTEPSKTNVEYVDPNTQDETNKKEEGASGVVSL